MSRNNIAIARGMRGLTRAALAEKLGVSLSQIGNWELGIRSPGPKNVVELAQALNVDEAWIAGHPTHIPVPDLIDKTVLSLPVIRSEEIDGYGTLYTALSDDVNPIAVIIGDGLTLVTRDWEGKQPYCAEDIADVDWLAPDGSPCVMMDGLPRAGWWV